MFRDIFAGIAIVLLLAAIALASFKIGGHIAAAIDAPHEPPQPSPIAKVVFDYGHGSAVHIGDGYFLTVQHNLAGDELPTLHFDDGSESEIAVMWANEEYDVALLHADDAGHVDAAPLSCRALDNGEAVTAHGNPQFLEFTTTRGTVAGREFSHAKGAALIPLDLTINTGMSGGPILDGSGSVVGLATGFLPNMSAGPPMAIDIGFAVPSTAICRLMGRA